jgi:hypothetical protein
MNAVSIQQPDAAALLAEQEPVNYAGWQTSHRGPLLIHAAKRLPSKDSAREVPGLVYNAVIGVVDLADCVKDDHLGTDPDEVGYYWVLTNLRVFARPLHVNGKVGLFQVSDNTVAAELARTKTPAKRKGRVKAREKRASRAREGTC